jgi:hypothetical protein
LSEVARDDFLRNARSLSGFVVGDDRKTPHQEERLVDIGLRGPFATFGHEERIGGFDPPMDRDVGRDSPFHGP